MKLHNMRSFRGNNSDSAEHAKHIKREFPMSRHITITVCDSDCPLPIAEVVKSLKSIHKMLSKGEEFRTFVWHRSLYACRLFNISRSASRM